MRQAHTRNSINYEMDTKNRGSITPQGGSPTGSVGRKGRGGYEEPEEFTTGGQCHVGLGAREALNPDEGCDEDGY